LLVEDTNVKKPLRVGETFPKARRAEHLQNYARR
jgi:hypothetical protein